MPHGKCLTGQDDNVVGGGLGSGFKPSRRRHEKPARRGEIDAGASVVEKE
jgi:hypothetical protein